MRLLAVVPALNEDTTVAAVVGKILVSLPGADVLVVDDGSTDGTAYAAAWAGAMVVRLPHNLGIGSAVQTGYMFAAERGYDLCVQVDGDGQHDPIEIPALLRPLLAGEADLVIGSRFMAGPGYEMSPMRRIGSVILAGVVTAITGRKITDTTSGFRACNREVIRFCARHYPSDYPEPEAIVLLHRAGFRIKEVPVAMAHRQGGASSITLLRSVYYMDKVLLAIFIGLLRSVPHRSELVQGG